jgi:hypothetical protein
MTIDVGANDWIKVHRGVGLREMVVKVAEILALSKVMSHCRKNGNDLRIVLHSEEPATWKAETDGVNGKSGDHSRSIMDAIVSLAEYMEEVP